MHDATAHAGPAAPDLFQPVGGIRIRCGWVDQPDIVESRARKKLQRILDSKSLLSRAFGRGDDLRRIANEPPTVSVIDTEQLGPGHRPLVVTEGVSSDARERRSVFETRRLPIFGTGSSAERNDACGERKDGKSVVEV